MKLSGILTVLLLAVPVNGVVAADEAPLRQRISELEKRVGVLERHLEEIRGQERWKDPLLWQRIKKGMTTSAIESLLGRPARTEKRIFETWYYHPSSKLHSFVWFDEGNVLGWKAPD